MTIKLGDYEGGDHYDGDYAHDLAKLQKRLAKIQVAHIIHKRSAIVMFEGWDAAGKGGIIQRLSARWDPRHFEVYPIAAPTAEAGQGRHRDLRPQLVRSRAGRAR
jgi:polyphosphate kinase 2 (PPK2 family)